MKEFLTAVGLALVMEGIPYFISPEKMREWMGKLTQAPDGVLRQIGFLLMMLGLFVVYLVRG